MPTVPLSTFPPPGTEAAILDARRGSLITAQGLDPDLDALLVSEAAAFAALLAVAPPPVAALPPLPVAA